MEDNVEKNDSWMICDHAMSFCTNLWLPLFYMFFFRQIAQVKEVYHSKLVCRVMRKMCIGRGCAHCSGCRMCWRRSQCHHKPSCWAFFVVFARSRTRRAVPCRCLWTWTSTTASWNSFTAPRCRRTTLGSSCLWHQCSMVFAVDLFYFVFLLVFWFLDAKASTILNFAF